jgi:hypothetical protein
MLSPHRVLFVIVFVFAMLDVAFFFAGRMSHARPNLPDCGSGTAPIDPAERDFPELAGCRSSH